MYSTLVDCINYSPNHSGARTHSIDRITPHCFVGQVTAERGLEVFLPTQRQASCNYVIGTDGKVGLSVDENNRSWCSSSSANDQRAITIECASDNTQPYALNERAYSKLIELCVDICRRYNKKKLIWINDKDKALSYVVKDDEMLLTVHRWFSATLCPGQWLLDRMGNLANEVTSRLTNHDDFITVYKVQLGAFKVKENAINQKHILENEGYDAFVTYIDGLYKVQLGAFKVKENAVNFQKELKSKGYDCFITSVQC